jgi:hypothetical protein
MVGINLTFFLGVLALAGQMSLWVLQADTDYAPGMIGLGLIYLWHSFHTSRAQYLAQYRSEEPIYWKIDDAEWITECNEWRTRFEWRHVERIREVKDGFLVYIEPTLAHWIPQKAFANGSEVQRFRQLVNAHLPSSLGDNKHRRPPKVK